MKKNFFGPSALGQNVKKKGFDFEIGECKVHKIHLFCSCYRLRGALHEFIFDKKWSPYSTAAYRDRVWLNGAPSLDWWNISTKPGSSTYFSSFFLRRALICTSGKVPTCQFFVIFEPLVPKKSYNPFWKALGLNVKKKGFDFEIGKCKVHKIHLFCSCYRLRSALHEFIFDKKWSPYSTAAFRDRVWLNGAPSLDWWNISTKPGSSTYFSSFFLRRASICTSGKVPTCQFFVIFEPLVPKKSYTPFWKALGLSVKKKGFDFEIGKCKKHKIHLWCSCYRLRGALHHRCAKGGG